MPLATPQELEKYPPPPLPFWVQHPDRAYFPGQKPLLLKPEDQIQFFNKPTKTGKFGEPYWVSSYGPQTWGLVCPYDEILCGGRRGGGKSALLIAWFAMGDPFLALDDPAHYSYLLEPSFRGLMLRKEYQSLSEFIDEAEAFFAPLGGKPKDDPVVFEFDKGKGAKIYTNHLGDKSAFEKYRGMGITKIGIEELTQIEDERSYLKLLGSLRAKRQVRTHMTQSGPKRFPALRSQIMSTANPDGPGRTWVKKRFVKVYNPRGKVIAANTVMRDPISLTTRIFIPMTLKDNPYLRENRQYEGFLLQQDEATKQAWIHGNWDYSDSTFFGEFRPDGPVTIEEREKYPWAQHVIDAVELRPWWHRWGGGDWGYDHPAAFHKFCRSEVDGRIHCYDELMLRQYGSFEVGVRLAEWWLPDLERLPDKTVTIAFSTDAFSTQDDTRTKAEQIANGIRSVLGPYGAFLLRFSDDERAAMARDPLLAEKKFAQHKERAAGNLVIVLKPASKDVAARWSYVRELLRFRPLIQETEVQLKARLTATYGRAGVEAYERELSKVKRQEKENLPRLRIWKGKAPQLVRCLNEATKDEDHPEKVKKWNAVDGIGGDDALEAFGHGCHHFKDIETRMPKSYYVTDRIEQIQVATEKETGERITDPTRLVMIHQTAESRYDIVHPTTGRQLYIPRASSSRHRQPRF